jgi:hypothetical protein
VPVGEAHLVDDALVVGPAHEAVEGRKGAGGQELQVADRAVGELEAGEAAGVGAHLGQLLGRHQEVDEATAVRFDHGRCLLRHHQGLLSHPFRACR